MRKFLLFILVIISACCARASSTTDVSALLHRDTWSFSAEEIKTLNEVNSGDMVTKLAASITNKSGILMQFRNTITINDNHADWTKFNFIDLNGDNVAEIVVYISSGPRRPGGSLYILSRQSGSHYCDIVSCDGYGMRLWPTNNQALIIGSELFIWSSVDPYYPFKLLHAWTGTNCIDVSQKYRSFFESQLIPDLTNKLSQTYQHVIRGKMEEGEWYEVAVKAMHWALAADKLNEMFPELPVVREMLNKAYDLLRVVPLEDDEYDGHHILVKEFRNMQERIRLKICVVNK